jgi:hypothetical protein
MWHRQEKAIPPGRIATAPIGGLVKRLPDRGAAGVLECPISTIRSQRTWSGDAAPTCRSTRFWATAVAVSRGRRADPPDRSGSNRHDASVHGSDALNEIARRLAHDLGTRFPGIEVRFDERAEAMTCQVSDGGSCWGTVGTWVDPGDDLADSEFEELLVSIAEDIADNLWPDELTDPWPPCPQHGDHPLHPGVVRGRAAWACRRDGRVAIVIGNLGGS